MDSHSGEEKERGGGGGDSHSGELEGGRIE